MPVPTDTFRKPRRLNVVFALSALALLGSVGWMVMDDYNREFRPWQRRARDWQASIVSDRLQQATNEETVRRLKRIRRQIETIARSQSEGALGKQIAELDGLIVAKISDRDLISLRAATFKGHIVPLKQQIEMARLETPVNSDDIARLARQLVEIQKEFDDLNNDLLGFEKEIEEAMERRAKLQAEHKRRTTEYNNLVRESKALEEKLAQLAPDTAFTKLGSRIRDAPLLDWLNPSEKPVQIVVPDVLTDLNTYVVETLDRCQSCHVNIDNPAFGESNLLLYAERSLARFEGQDTTTDPGRHPVVLAGFWLDAAHTAGADLAGRLDDAVTETLEQINALRDGAGEAAPDLAAEAEARRAQLLDAIARIGAMPAEEANTPRHQAVRYFVDDIKATLRRHLGDEQFGLLVDLYRHELLTSLNAHRVEHDLPALDATSVMLAHPDLDRYVGTESAHPADHPTNPMGCTVCHEGSGQETIFEHTAHSPRSIWVDRLSGTPIPDFLVTPGDAHDAGGRDAAHGATINDDAPFSPRAEIHTTHTGYHRPGGSGGEAVQQKTFWKKAYGWAHVHFMHWEKPMHELDYVESSCNKCHSDVYDLRDTAPRLFKGRQLFAEAGCVNCHAVTDLEDDLDIRQIGPSLSHLKEKLSFNMAASWIWSPKALRPTTRMPHYFMLENNASPVEIMRTRVEVAAMTRYLMEANPGPGADESARSYAADEPPEDPGDAENGRLLFHQVGCQACHTNLNETGRAWITDDLMTRRGLDADEANEFHDALSENDRHWYVLEHLGHRLQQTGPELSAVGTKLMAGGRTPEEARTWLYNWLLNPRSYHSYTIMPQLRLTPEEASDIAAYLLDQTRDDYQTGEFSLDDHGREMLKALVINLLSGQSSHTLARETVESHPERWSEANQMMFLGEKMISHYGCSGCHQINGFEEAVSACTKLDDWGLKDPHMLDFGHFEHAFDRVREHTRDVDIVRGAGLSSDTPQIDAESARLATRGVEWETIENERRPWLYHKLHNSRIYDRGRTSLDGGATLAEDGRPQITADYRPYDKLKMPRFFFSESQVKALVTYVTSVRRPLVNEPLRQVADAAMQRVIRGRQIAQRYNCYGCHNIDGNDVHIHDYFQVYDEDGLYDSDALNWAPPRLVGQGAKTQPDWLYGFLQNVQPIRPWLRIRMPSFALTEEEAAGLADYFAGHAQVLHERLGGDVATVDAHVKAMRQRLTDLEAKHTAIEARLAAGESGDDPNLTAERDDLAGRMASAGDEATHWFESDNPLVTAAMERLGDFGIASDLVLQQQLTGRDVTREEAVDTWNTLLRQTRTLAGIYETRYPYTHPFDPDGTAASSGEADMQYERGRQLFTIMGCMTGLCHRVGDQELLAANDMLVATSMEEMIGDDGGEDEGYDDEDYDDEDYDDEDYDDEGYGEEFAGPRPVKMRPDGPPGGAPNLSLVAERLQSDWVKQWLVHSNIIQPGTRMQQYFRDMDGHFPASFFDGLPEDERQAGESMYGYTAEQQRELLTAFLYTVGPRRVTLKPDGDPLAGGPAEPVTLATLAPPPVVETVTTDATAPSAEKGPSTVEPAKETPKADGQSMSVEPAGPVPIVGWHDDATATFEGEAVQGHRTRVIGQITLDGKRKRMGRLRMDADMICAQQHERPIRTETEVITKDGLVANALVYVNRSFKGTTFEMPPPARVDQVGCVYVPHVTAVMAGQGVRISNSDATSHNVNILARTNKATNFMQARKGIVTTKTFSRPEQGIVMKCDVHPWMNGVLHVLEHPYFSVTDKEGRFEIKGLPPGSYTMEVIHESKRIKPVTFEVTVEADTSHRANAALQAD